MLLRPAKQSFRLLNNLTTVGLIIAIITVVYPLKIMADNHINLRLNWRVGGEHVAYFVAKERDIYINNGLSVNISQGAGSSDTILNIAMQRFDVGLAASSNIIQGISKGMPLTVIGVLYQNDPTCFTALAESNIRTIKDLEGKKVGIQYDSSTFVEYLAVLRRNAIQRKNIHEVAVSFDISPLLLGLVDVFPGFVTQRPLQVKMAGREPSIIMFKDYGVNQYGVCIFTRKDYFAKNERLIKKFINATKEAWLFVKDHPRISSQILIKIHPELKEDYIYKEIKSLLPLMFPTGSPDEFGCSTKSRWENAMQLLFEYKFIESKLPYKEIVGLNLCE